MADDAYEDEDLFADLYDDEAPKAAKSAPLTIEQKPTASVNTQEPALENVAVPSVPDAEQPDNLDGMKTDAQAGVAAAEEYSASMDAKQVTNQHGFTGTVGIKDDGKMFIGGLNWETDEKSMHEYFSQFGEVIDCTVMRDNNTGRSRGFGFLTFKDPKAVNSVMVREHHLDGKIIDPKRAIPKEEQERTAKIFVGGVSQDCTEAQFVEFFEQFGRVIDATLMMDKETNRPRGFGFVTFEGEEPVNACLAQDLFIMNKQVEVKRAQPRGGVEDQPTGGMGRGRGRGRGDAATGPNAANGASVAAQTNGMSPSQLAQYWMQMQQYFQMAQQQVAMGMNPMMQMMMMQQQQQMQGNGGAGSPGPGQMTPQMMQQMQQMQQQMGGSPAPGGSGTPTGPAGHLNRSAQDQQSIEQQKFAAQEARAGGGGGSAGPGQGGPYGGYGPGGYPQQGFQQTGSSWDGMYDDVPQPNMNMGNGMQIPTGPGGMDSGSGFRGGRGGGFRGRGRGGGGHFNDGPPANAPSAPAGAPTGPKNPGPRGGGYRGGRGGGNRHHPYSRNRG